MKHSIYNHNRDIYISFPATKMLFAKSGNIICHGDLALFTVKANEAHLEVTELVKKNCPTSVNVDLIEKDMLQVLVLYVSDDKDHIAYLQNAVKESEQFRTALTVNFTGLSSDKDSRVITADFALPMQHKFVHLNTLSLRYAG